MKRTLLLSAAALAAFAGVATAGEAGRPYSPYHHHPYYPHGWYSPRGPEWVRWWGLREPWVPPSGAAWSNPAGPCGVDGYACHGPTVPMMKPGAPPCTVEHDVEVSIPDKPYGSWQNSLQWLRKNPNKCK